MNSFVNSGLICIKNQFNIEFTVCKLEYILNEDESFKYIFTPYYDVIDLLDSKVFDGIPGLDLSLRKETYIRENKVPVFISERVPSENRENFQELLAEVNMSYMEPIEYLYKTKKAYSGDNLYMIPFENRKNVYLEDIVKKSNSFGIINLILENIAHGNSVYINGNLINGKNVYETLLFIYDKSYRKQMDNQNEGIKKAKERGAYKGRKPIQINELSFLEQLEKVEKGLITPKEASNNLGISIDKYYRFKKTLQK